MYYEYIVNVPPQTPERLPYIQTFTPLQGFIQRVEIEFVGSLGILGVQLCDEGRQFAPMPSGWLIGDKRVISWSETIRLQGPPYRLVVKAYNLAVDWPHRFVIRMEVTNASAI